MNEHNPYASPAAASAEIAHSGPGNLASRGDRFIGSLIDGLILLPLSFGLGFALGMVLISIGIAAESMTMTIASSVLGSLLGIGLFLAINGYLLATRGQTVGKTVVKTKIVNDDGSDVEFGPLVLKRYLPLWIISAIPFVGGLFGIVDALFIFRDNHKCIHDEIANTKVIKLAS